jgi:DNA polymerase-3 subunit epsilon
MSTMKTGCLQSGTAPEHCAAPASEPEGMARELEMTGDFRVLRRLRTRLKYGEPDGSRLHRGIYVDVETTGLDPVNDEIIELSLLPFDFASDGRVFSVHEPFERFRDPGRAIPDVVTGITGITNEMVAGASVDPAEVEAFLDGAVLVVAHNASFDRPFAERLCGAFADLPWACSCAEVPWSREGYTDGAKLRHLAAAAGFFFDGHRASADCRAGLELLARRLPRSGRTALDLLLTSVRTPRWRVAALGAPFELRHVLKSRGYRWQAGDDGRLRAWVVEVADDALDAEETFLSREIYGSRDSDIDVRRIDAFDRYSDRG